MKTDALTCGTYHLPQAGNGTTSRVWGERGPVNMRRGWERSFKEYKEARKDKGGARPFQAWRTAQFS